MADTKLTDLTAVTIINNNDNIYVVQSGVSKKATVNQLPISAPTQTALDLKVDENVAITGATKTKITYDSKGLVTAGADATTNDIADSLNKRYVTDANLTTLSNTSGTNTGDQDLSNFETTTQLNTRDTNNRDRTNHTGTQLASTISDFQTTVSANSNVTANTAKISFDSTSSSKLAGIEAGAEVNTITSVAGKTGVVTLAKADVGLSNVVNTDTTTTANITDSTNKRFVTDANLTVISNTSGTNTGDNAVNSLYSGLASSKQDTLVSGTNIKTINGASVLGSGDLVVSGSGGEINTASNVGTAGVGVFKQKTGVDLEFKKINAGSSKVTITDDTGNNEIDIGVTEANFRYLDIQASGSGGVVIKNNSGTAQAEFGSGGGTNATINGTINIATASADYHQVAGGTGTITDTATGSSTNININLVPKGTGRLQAGGVNIPTISSTDTLTNKTISGSNNTITNIAQSSVTNLGTDLSGKQATLVSGTNIKTVNSTTLLGSGNVAVEPTITAGTTGQYYRGDKTFQTLDKTAVGLANVDNTSDSTKNSATVTLTNKRITKRTGTTTSSATPTINTDNVDFYSITALAVDITSFTTNLSGTPTDGQTLWIAITGTATRTIAWGSSFEASTVALPTTTTSTARLDVGFVWNTTTSKWRCIAVA